MNTAPTIKLADLQLAACAHRLSRYTNGRTVKLAALTKAPMVELDCSRPTRCDKYARESAQSLAHHSAPTVSPLRRGHIAELIERTRWMHSLAEIRTTWGQGIKALLAEDRYLVKGGQQ